jgi:ATP-binding cassette subfamily D (ALD) long-chain fatty acid import protein
VGYVVVALPLVLNWSKALESDYVTTGLYDLGMLSWGFTQLTLVTSDLSEFAGYCSRVGLMLQALLSFEQEDSHVHDTVILDSETGLNSSRIESLDAVGLNVTNLTIRDPQGNILITNAQLNLKSNTLIMGGAGTGKTSLFRVLAGLWRDFSGRIELSPEVMYVPQDVYLPMASLRQQLLYPLLYPDRSHHISMHTILQVLSSLGLEFLLKLPNWEQVKDWSFLSPGQQQKLVMARVLLQRPKLALLDEISSMVDLSTEKIFYQLCAQAGIRVLSIGHRASLEQFHDAVFDIRDCKLLRRRD